MVDVAKKYHIEMNSFINKASSSISPAEKDPLSPTGCGRFESTPGRGGRVRPGAEPPELHTL